MAAVVVVKEGNEAGIAYNTVTAARFCCSDVYNPGLVTPIPIPAGGIGNYAYSWWKHWALDLSGSFTQIDNIKVFCDGTIGFTFGTGGKIEIGIRDAGDNGCPEASYQQAAGTAATGDYMDHAADGHAYYKDQTAPPADIENYTDGSELQVDTAAYTAADVADGIICQLKIDGDAILGDQTDETITWEFDEI